AWRRTRSHHFGTPAVTSTASCPRCGWCSRPTPRNAAKGPNAAVRGGGHSGSSFAWLPGPQSRFSLFLGGLQPRGIFLAVGGTAVLALAAVGRAALVVRVFAVAVVLLAAAGVRVLGFDRTSPRDQHRSWVLLELGFVILAAGSLLGIVD